MGLLSNADIESRVQKRLTELLVLKKALNQRLFYFGQVISNEDSGNLNRIKIRIPRLDDIFYNEGLSKEEADKNLPWAVPLSNRFIDTPEVNAIVLVAVFDPKIPFFGRIYFNSLTDISTISLFDKMQPENEILSNLDLVEDIFQIRINFKNSQQTEIDGQPNINYNVGIRGKGDNRVILKKDEVELIQGLAENESKLILKKNTTLEAANVLDLLSKKGSQEIYQPVFNEPTFKYLKSVNNLLKKIVKVLAVKPAISPTGPCTASPEGLKLANELMSLIKDFQEYTKNGSSKKININ